MDRNEYDNQKIVSPYQSELSKVIQDASVDAMIIVDHEGRMIKINPATSKMFQYEEQELIGNSIFVLFQDDLAKDYLENSMIEIHNLGRVSEEFTKKEMIAAKKDGQMFPCEIQLGVKHVQNTYFIACIIRDITTQKKNEEIIKYMAYHDNLTDLPNRRALNITLSEHIKEARKSRTTLGVMFLDMDRFKFINDSLGHTIGDKALQEIAYRLSQTVRDGDFVARIGGDEFSIVLPNTDREAALQVAEKILNTFIQPLLINNYELTVTTCIGLSMFPYDGENVIDLLRNADAALYRSKEQGKNKYHVFHSGMDMKSYRSFMMQNDLRKALEKNELELFYQPRVNIETGKVESAEALLRWNHPHWGMISPMEFIPLAEETGQILEIGEWVLKSVCNQINQWKDNGLLPIRVAINFSIQQLLQKNLIDYIEQVLDETGVSPTLLEIEITESVIINNEDMTTRILKQLKTLGIRISIDDFGTGYSSLYYLSRLPVNTLKIDKSFIKGIEDPSGEDRSIITTIILLAKSFNLSVIAEGVETEDQLNFLRKEQCKEVQGYLFSPPVLPDEFQDIIIQGNYNVSLFEESISATKNYTEMENHKQNVIHAALDQIRETYSISVREAEVFELILAGLSNKEISEQLYISEHTVKNHITRIFQKLNVNDRAQAMAMVYQICINSEGNLISL